MDFENKKIDDFRNQFEKRGYVKKEIERGDKKYEYYILPSSGGPIKNFVFRMTNTLSGNNLFGISEDVDEKFHRFPIWHEIMEFLELVDGVSRTCSQAAKQEIALLMQDRDLNLSQKGDYLKMRYQFFLDLVAYAKEKKLSTVAEFQASLEVFEEAVNL